MRSPLWLAMVKLSKVAVWLFPPRNSIALPAETIDPPPVAMMEAPFPCSATAAVAFAVVMLSFPVAVIDPAEPLDAASLAKSPIAPAPDVVMVAAPRLICEPRPSALTPKAPRAEADRTPPT